MNKRMDLYKKFVLFVNIFYMFASIFFIVAIFIIALNASPTITIHDDGTSMYYGGNIRISLNSSEHVDEVVLHEYSHFMWRKQLRSSEKREFESFESYYDEEWFCVLNTIYLLNMSKLSPIETAYFEKIKRRYL